MNYPKLNEIPTTRDLLDKFKGYNHNLRIDEGEFYDMQNLTGDDYPILSPRKKRGTAITTTNANGMCSNTRFCYVDGQDFHMVGKDENGEQKDETVDLKLVALDKDKPTRDLISIGSNVVIMPDQKYINTVDIAQRGHLRAGVFDLPDKIQGSNIEPELKIVGVYMSSSDDFTARTKPLIIVRRGQQLPTATKELAGTVAFAWETHLNEPPQYYIKYCTTALNNSSYYLWSGLPHSNYDPDYKIFKIGIYSENDDMDYWDATMMEIEKAIADNKDVTINGLYEGVSNFVRTLYATKFTVDSIEKSGLVLSVISDSGMSDPTDKNAFVEWLFDGVDTIKTKTITTPISIETSAAKNSIVPIMDCIIESSNRLWGCRYGKNNAGDFVNKIYASELGNFKNWTPLEDATVATSPYIVPVGTSGKFTGAVNYAGKPIFFKEDCMHRVFGDYPANYQVQTIMCKGVQEGCNKSLVIVNDVLYYKSRSGICAYDGSLPVEISGNFGDKQYSNAVGGTIGNKYYVSMKDIETDDYVLFVYDTIKRMWHKEDNTEVTQFCNHKGELYYIDRSDRYIHTIKGTGVVETQPIRWGAETGILGATTPDDKYVTKIDIRMSVAKGSKVSLHIEYDSMGEWERLMEIEGLTLNTFTIPVRPRRCDHFRLKFEGEGDAKIFSISKTLEETE